MNALVYFKDGHTDKCNCARPYNDNYCEFYIQSGLYAFKDYHFYKYYPEFLIKHLSINGDCEYDSSNCWVIDNSIDRIEIEI